MKYKFSVIMPIYNVEPYLEEAIKSVINQSIGFDENIQLILVNDGSTDNSEQICLKYEKLYPENIIYIKQENHGVSSARNNGMKYAEGKYVNFLDSDDKWNYDVFDKVYDFFEEYQNEIDIVSCRVKFFEGKEGYHPLDYKFEEDGIVDIRDKYDYIQLSAATCFIKADVLKNYKYNTNLKYSEDAVLVSEILMEKSKYGILTDCIYNYRKRKAKTSALQVRDNQKKLYFDLTELEEGYKLLIQKSKEKYGQVIPYFQYLIMYNLQWKLKRNISLYLSDEEKEKYMKELQQILQNIDDSIIMEQRYIWSEYKILALSIKHNEDIREKLQFKEGNLYYGNVQIYQLARRPAIKITKIFLHRKKLVLIGNITYYLPKEDYKLYANIDGENLIISKFKSFKTETAITKTFNHYREFKIKIPLNVNNTEIKFVIDYKGNKNVLCHYFKEDSNFKVKHKKVKIKKGDLTLNADTNTIVVKKEK